jgi:hypothetical protein
MFAAAAILPTSGISTDVPMLETEFGHEDGAMSIANDIEGATRK